MTGYLPSVRSLVVPDPLSVLFPFQYGFRFSSFSFRRDLCPESFPILVFRVLSCLIFVSFSLFLPLIQQFHNDILHLFLRVGPRKVFPQHIMGNVTVVRSSFFSSLITSHIRSIHYMVPPFWLLEIKKTSNHNPLRESLLVYVFIQ